MSNKILLYTDELQQVYTVNSEYLVTEFKSSKPKPKAEESKQEELSSDVANKSENSASAESDDVQSEEEVTTYSYIWNMRDPKTQPIKTAAADIILKEKKDALLPYRALYIPGYEKPALNGAYLNPNELVTLDSEYKDENRVYRLNFFANQSNIWKETNPIRIESSEQAKPVAITALSPNQFVIAYSNNYLHIWSRQHDQENPFNFKHDRTIDLSKQSWPVCKKVTASGGYELQPECRVFRKDEHYCHKYVTYYDHEVCANEVKAIDMIPSNYMFGLQRVNSAELIFIQGNNDYQLIQKVNAMTSEVTGTLEIVRHMSSVLPCSYTFYPLPDGRTFLVDAVNMYYDRNSSHPEGARHVFDAQSMSLYTVPGLNIWRHDYVGSILPAGEIVTDNYHQTNINVHDALPHIKAYRRNIAERVTSLFPHEILSRNPESIVAAYVDNDVVLTEQEQKEFTVDCADYYGNPVATSVPRDHADYDCDVENKGSDQAHEHENAPTLVLSNNKSTLFVVDEMKPVAVVAEPLKVAAMNP